MSKDNNGKTLIIEEGCIGCGACAAVCDEVFDLNEEGQAFIRQESDLSKSDCIENAIGVCPVGVIKYND